VDSTEVFALSFAIGVVDGLRSMTAPAAVCWAARWKWLRLEQTGLAFLGSTAAPYIFTVFALMELVADKLPHTPSRTMPASMLIRVVLGGLSGAALCASSHQSLIAGAVLGGAGGVAGGFGGYQARMRLSRALKAPLAVALLEDVVAIGCAFLIVSRF
jgi:uncharacterized membrane protein